MALPMTAMTLADGKDPIDSAYAAASASSDLNEGSASVRSQAAAERAIARFSLDGKAAIITGGYGGLGFECGLAMLEHGVQYLGIVDLRCNPQKLHTLTQRGGRDTCVREFLIDLSQDDSAEKAVTYFCDIFPRLDIVLSCTGIVGAKHSFDETAAGWRRMQDINTTSGFLIAQAAAKKMIAFATARGESPVRCNGSIILISSISAHHVNFPQPQVAYNASKAAISHIARCLAAEWAVYGIRVNSISPGYLDTALNVGEHLDQAKKLWFARTPLGRMGRTDEIAGTVILLCSPAGSYFTGSDIVIDGGSTIM